MVLKGMTWSHARGVNPLVAAAKKFNEMHPEVTIEWDARSLSDFEIFPLDQLASEYDMIMIDHPHIGTAYAQSLLVPLDEYIPQEFIDEQAKNAVGKSHLSYFWEGKQWALAADSAAQFGANRTDILKQLGLETPTSWVEVFELAKALQNAEGNYKMGIPFVPIHAYSSFFSVCSQLSDEQHWSTGGKLDKEVGKKALSILRQVLELSTEDSYDMDPINLLDRMGDQDEIIYCPLVYGYSTYSLDGYLKNVVKFSTMPSDTGKPEGSMIGGVGLSITSKSEYKKVAAEFIMMTMAPEFQKGTFVDNDGQPGHRVAWTDERVNEISADFYKDTLETMDCGSMRPRFNGYIEFQEKAGKKIRQFFMDGRTDDEAFVNELDELFFTFYNAAQ